MSTIETRACRCSDSVLALATLLATTRERGHFRPMLLKKQLHAAGAFVALLLGSSCSDDPAAPNVGVPGIRVLAGGEADTIFARPIQPLVVEVRGADGDVASGKTVQFSTLGSLGPDVSVASIPSALFTGFTADTTDIDGKATVFIAMGSVAGEAKLGVRVPEIGLSDTVIITVRPGAPALVLFNVRDTVLLIDSAFTLTAPIVDRYYNPRGETATLHNLTPTECSLTGTRLKGIRMGRCIIEAKHATMHDTARASILPFARIAVVSGATLHLASTNATGIKAILLTSSAVLSPGWAPNGSALVIYEGDLNFTAQLSVVDTNGVRLKTVGFNAGMALASLGRFSPDGQWIYFTGKGAVDDPMRIWRMKPDGTQRAAVTSLDVARPLRVDASPDGVTIAYDVADHIILANVNTQQKTSLAIEGIAPSFSPDGQTIAFYGANGVGLKLMRVDGTNIRTLSPDFFFEWQPPQWTADGQWLFVTGARFVNVVDGTTVPIVGLSNYQQIVLKPPLGQ